MRPKKFDFKPGKTNPNRLRRLTRTTSVLHREAQKLVGTAQDKAEQAAIFTLIRIQRSKEMKVANEKGVMLDEKRLFRRSASEVIRQKMKFIGVLHCAERSNLAIGLLHAAGEKAWLVRVLRKQPSKLISDKFSWEFHDMVEFVDEGKIKTLVFGGNPEFPVMMNYHIYEGSVDKSIKHSNFVVFRGADTKQIGGVGSWSEYEKYENRLNKEGVMQKEIEKNKRRVQLLIKEGIIPKEVVHLVP